MERSEKPQEFLSDEELSRVTIKIAGAEKLTSAEIKVVIAQKSNKDIRKRARRIFKKYKLHKTVQRNCVLILLITSTREFLVYGDQGIHEKVGQQFWEEARNTMLSMFRENRFGDGLCNGIHLIGERLSHYFPCLERDVNEISNYVEFED